MHSRVKRQWVLAVILALGMGAWMAAVAQEPANTGVAPAPLRVESKTTLWKLIRSGGWAMFPLGACSLLTITFTVLNFQRVNRARMVPLEVIGQIKAAAGTGDLPTILNLARTTDCFFTRSLVSGLKHINPDDPAASRPKMETAISETAGQEESRYGFYVNFLSLLTTMSPMWGLIGTVSGMIGAFSKIGEGGMGKPEILARNIGEALICTATGLIIAVTAMGFYFYFRNTLNAMMKDAEKHFTEILDLLTGSTGIPLAGADTERKAPAAR